MDRSKAGGAPGEGAWIEAREGAGERFVRAPLEVLATLVRSRDLVLAGWRRDWVARFTGTSLGFLWPLLQPALIGALYYFVFAELLGLRLPDGTGAKGALALYMLVGIFVWSALAESCTRGAGALVEHAGLVRRTTYPAQALPLVRVLTAHATQVLALALVVLGLAFSGGGAPDARLAWAPLVLVLQVALCFGLALALAALQAVLRDTREVVGVALVAAMFATPVFWVPALELVPTLARWLRFVDWNPFHHLLACWRWMVLGGEPALCFPQSFEHSLARLALAALVSLVLGLFVFGALRRRLVDEV